PPNSQNEPGKHGQSQQRKSADGPRKVTQPEVIQSHCARPGKQHQIWDEPGRGQCQRSRHDGNCESGQNYRKSKPLIREAEERVCSKSTSKKRHNEEMEVDAFERFLPSEAGRTGGRSTIAPEPVNVNCRNCLLEPHHLVKCHPNTLLRTVEAIARPDGAARMVASSVSP